MSREFQWSNLLPEFSEATWTTAFGGLLLGLAAILLGLIVFWIFRGQLLAILKERWRLTAVVAVTLALSGLAFLLPDIMELPTAAAWLFRSFGLLFSFGVTYFLAREDVKRRFREEERASIRDIASNAANTLNTVLHGLDTQKNIWQTICVEHKISRSMHESFANTLRFNQTTIQNSINSIFKMAGVNHNPYGLSNFEEEVKCVKCPKILLPKIMAYPEATVVVRCDDCNELQSIKRHFNGSLSSRPYKPRSSDAYQAPPDRETPKSIPPHGPDFESAPRKVKCPKCRAELLIGEGVKENIIRRGCILCKTNFEADLAAGTVVVISAPNKMLTAKDIQIDAFGHNDIKCDCGNTIPARFAKVRNGLSFINCRRCGALIEDPNGLMSKVRV